MSWHSRIGTLVVSRPRVDVGPIRELEPVEPSGVPSSVEAWSGWVVASQTSPIETGSRRRVGGKTPICRRVRRHRPPCAQYPGGVFARYAQVLATILASWRNEILIAYFASQQAFSAFDMPS